jgi:hypothetical protein
VPRGWNKSYFKKGDVVGFPTTAEPITVPIPVKGMNVRDPLASMDPSYAPWVYNVDTKSQFLKVRDGWDIHARFTDHIGAGMGVLAIAGTPEGTLIAYTRKATSSGNPSYAFDITTAGDYFVSLGTHTTVNGSGAACSVQRYTL